MEPLRIRNQQQKAAHLAWRITNLGQTADIYLYDQIGVDFWGDGLSAADFVRDLRALDVATINLHINSPGGYIDDALAIYNSLQQHPATITAHIEGIAASAASFVAMAADQVLIAPHASIMIHDAMSFVGIVDMANVQEIDRIISDLSSMRGLLDAESNNIASIFAERAGGTTAMWRDRMRANGNLGTSYIGQAAVDAGLATDIETAPSRAAAAASSRMQNRTEPASQVDPATPAEEGPEEEIDISLIPPLANGYKPPLPDFTRLVTANMPARQKE